MANSHDSTEPVAWAVYWGLPPTRKNSVHFDKESAQAVANQIKSATEVRPLYAAPVAQQPQAEKRCQYCDGTGDVHSIDGQWRGECHCQKQPQAEDTIKRQAQKIAELTADRDGWIEAHARLHREYHDFRKAAPQQAEAVPLPQQVMVDMVPPATARDRWMYEQGRLAERDPRTHAPPQQAESVPSSDLNPDEGDPVTLWAEIWRLREAVKGPDGYATWQDAATAERIRRVRAESKQAEEAKAVPTHDDTDLIKQMLEALRSCSGVSHWPALIPTINAARKRLETPQQADAVPSDVVRDALELAEEALGWHAAGFCEDSMPQLTVEALHAIRAAIAQQKGQP